MPLKPLVLSLGLIALLSQPALAQDRPDFQGGPEQHEMGRMERGPHGHGKPHRAEAPAPQNMHFEDARRDDIRGWMRESYTKRCPPGLAKKHKGCRAPGQSAKYRVGGRLPKGYKPVPPVLVERLGPPPVGASYYMVDNDVVLATQATKKILDAVTLFSAMNQ